MRNILFLGMFGLSLASCSSSPIKMTNSKMSSFEVKAITTKQYEESFDIVCNALGSFLVLEELSNKGGCYSRISVTREREFRYDFFGSEKLKKPEIEYSFNVRKIAPKLTEIELIIDIQDEKDPYSGFPKMKRSYNKAYYDEVYNKIRLEIERIKAINR